MRNYRLLKTFNHAYMQDGVFKLWILGRGFIHQDESFTLNKPTGEYGDLQEKFEKRNFSPFGAQFGFMA